MSARVLVAGIGNIFLGDDAFGVEVVRRLAGVGLPEGVRVVDFGIRGVHLAFELLDKHDLVILVDAAPRGSTPGTIHVIEPDLSSAVGTPPSVPTAGALIDAHGMEPASVLALVKSISGDVGRVLVVGCEPAEVEERIGLSEPVAAAVNDAVKVVRQLVEQFGQERRAVGENPPAATIKSGKEG